MRPQLLAAAVAASAIGGLAAGAGRATADDVVVDADQDLPPPPRPFRFSVGAGAGFLVTGEGDLGRNRGSAHLDIMPGGRFGRFGLTTALRNIAFDPIFEDTLITAGVSFEAAAARPRLVLALHADVGFVPSSQAPALGGGLQTHLWIAPKHLGPVALVFDLTGHLVIDGSQDTRFVISSATRLSISR